MKQLIEATVSEVSEDDVVTADRKFPPVKLLENGCKAMVMRRPKNMTLRHAEVAVYKGRGRKPTQGEVVRPFVRTYKGKVLPATPPDETQTWQEMYKGEEVTVKADVWRGVLPMPQKDWTAEQRKLVKQTVWTTVVAHHPGFKEPLVILMTVDFTVHQARQVVRGRWGIEQPPWSPNKCWAVIASLFTTPTCASSARTHFCCRRGFNLPRRHKRSHPNGLVGQAPKTYRRSATPRIIQSCFARFIPPAQLRQKNSKTVHLPKGFHPALAAARFQAYVT